MSDITTQVDVVPEVAVETGVETTESNTESTGSENDPNESFSDWMARQGKGKEEVKAPKEEVKKEETSEKKEEEAPKEDSKEKTESLKVGDKEYKAEDIEGLVKSSADLETLKSEITDMFEQLRTSPGEWFDKLEISQKAIEDYYYSKYIEPGTLTAEQKLERYEQRDKAAKEAEETSKRQQAEEAQKEHYRQQWTKDISAAIQEAGLPNNEFTTAKVASYLKAALAKGVQASPRDVMDLVKQDLESTHKSSLTGMTPEQLAATLGPEMMAKLRQHEVDKYKTTKFENKNPGKGALKDTKSQEVKRKVSSVYDLLD